MRHSHDSARHTDEVRVIEDHAQTAQKLTFYRGYAGAWGNILAQAKLSQPITDIFLIDTHCGAGRHGSREHPDGAVLGTPLIACQEARRLQRRYPKLTVHVRAVDNDERWIRHLLKRVQPFLVTSHNRDRVDVKLYAKRFEDVLAHLLDEVMDMKAPSLWLIDPYGLQVPYSVVSKLQEPRWGPEVIINLDMLGMWRVDAAARAKIDENVDAVVLGDYDAQNCLNELFGGREHWENIADHSLTFRDNAPRFAAAYAERFPRFKYRSHYPLRASHGQLRHIVHLCHSDFGKEKFHDEYLRSQDFGILAGRHLDGVTKAHAASRYWQSYQGETTSVDRLYEEGTQSWDKGQIRSICTTADEDRYGRYDEDEGLIQWFKVRGEDPTEKFFQPTLFN
jgi:three-Cys-motif partner protein